MPYMTDKLIASRNEGYNPNRAGEQMLKACEVARRQLIARLDKPSISDKPAYERWMIKVRDIRAMGYNDLMAAMAS